MASSDFEILVIGLGNFAFVDGTNSNSWNDTLLVSPSDAFQKGQVVWTLGKPQQQLPDKHVFNWFNTTTNSWSEFVLLIAPTNTGQIGANLTWIITKRGTISPKLLHSICRLGWPTNSPFCELDKTKHAPHRPHIQRHELILCPARPATN